MESEGKEVKCKTKASFKAIQKALNIDKVVVYAGLSLCKDTSKPDQSSLYLECSNEVKRIVEKELQLQGEDVLVAPNVFGNKVRQVDGKTTLYFNYVYYNSLKILEENNPDEVYIDITHGVNYMPLLATEAIKLASYVYAIDKKNLTIRIYNSEPVIGKSEGPYHISKVFEEKVNTRISLLAVLTPFLQSNIKNLIINKLSKELKCDKELILPSANALFSGIFLFLLMNKNEIMKCMESVEQRIKVLDYGQPSINLALEGTTLVYKDKMDIELSYLHALLKVLSKIIGSRKVEENCVKLSDIRDLTEKYYTSELIRSAVLNEIDKLEGNRDKLTSEPEIFS
ncbi:TIGR01897 family CRISPR-associated protein [Stygiolobus azoricus]|uniref:TIGR01897 family CRISPR-associated protein n=1 Tax=Stygiolobus azoricus TaxID=41675 RepID=A0A650CPK9_9CREN|nr:TIGR01897 family CRISPR-associated protein [Stygiolobus azoricus]